MAIKTAICDDEKNGLEYVRKYLETYYFETGIEFITTFYESPEDLLNDYDEPHKYDLLFLDVEMPGTETVERGIEVAKQIRSIPDYDVRIIFVSNYPEYMNLGYDVQASHYLSKDTSFHRFKQVLDGTLFHIEADKDVLCVKTGRDEKVLLRICDILYVESFHRERNRVVYHMKDGQLVSEHRTILSAGASLKPHGFAFVNKYRLVNLRFIQRFNNEVLYLDNQEKIPLSRYYKKEFLQNFSENILKL